jgi:hypothetical protein
LPALLNIRLILGNNGIIFIAPPMLEGETHTGGYVLNLDRVSLVYCYSFFTVVKYVGNRKRNS